MSEPKPESMEDESLNYGEKLATEYGDLLDKRKAGEEYDEERLEQIKQLLNSISREEEGM